MAFDPIGYIESVDKAVLAGWIGTLGALIGGWIGARAALHAAKRAGEDLRKLQAHEMKQEKLQRASDLLHELWGDAVEGQFALGELAVRKNASYMDRMGRIVEDKRTSCFKLLHKIVNEHHVKDSDSVFKAGSLWIDDLNEFLEIGQYRPEFFQRGSEFIELLRDEIKHTTDQLEATYKSF